jgi:hypothetical protein
MNERLAKALKQKPSTETIYVIWSLAIGLFFLARMLWAWPDATWQSQLWFIQDIDEVLAGNLDKASWIELGNGQSTNGYKWFLYISAALFGLNAQLENAVYAAMLTGASIAIGKKLLEFVPTGNASSKALVFVIPLILLSFPGAGSRGMELGTFAGLTLFLLLALSLLTPQPLKVWAAKAAAASIAFFFVFLGGYAAGVVAAVLLVTLINFSKPNPLSARLRILSVSLVLAMLLFIASLLIAGRGEASSSLSKLSQIASTEPLFVPRFLSVGFAGGILNTQTIEALPTSLGIPVASSVSAVVFLLAAGVFVSSVRARNPISAPGQLFIIYGVANYFMLLLFRPNDQYQLLNTWYSLHTKVLLIGVVWLAIVNSEYIHRLIGPNKLRRLVPSALVVVLIFTSAVANAIHLGRHVHEREYFLNVASATIFPETLKETGGITQLIVSQEESLKAIDVLQRHNLGVYRDPQKTLDLLSGGKGYMRQGDSYGDGWMGLQMSVVSISESCTNLTITARSIDASISTLGVAYADKREELIVDPKSLQASLAVNDLPEMGKVLLSSSITRSPEELGGSQDSRNLSFHISVQCQSRD